MTGTILFVDDEERRMDTYIRELRDAGYKVIPKTSIDDADDFFSDLSNDIDLLVLDMMMSPGIAFKEYETHYGLKTGQLFYEKVRKKYPDLPILVFTNLVDEDLEKKINQSTNSEFLHKVDFMSLDFAKKVTSFLKIILI